MLSKFRSIVSWGLPILALSGLIYPTLLSNIAFILCLLDLIGAYWEDSDDLFAVAFTSVVLPASIILIGLVLALIISLFIGEFTEFIVCVGDILGHDSVNGHRILFYARVLSVLPFIWRLCRSGL